MLNDVERFEKYESQFRELINSLESSAVEYEKFIELAGFRFKILGNTKRFSKMVEPSFRHLFISSTPDILSDYQIILFEGETNTEFLPEYFWRDLFSKQVPKVANQPEMFVTEHFRACYLPNLRAIIGLDSLYKKLFYWTEDLRKLPLSEFSSPLRLNFLWWANSVGYQILHAGAVSTDKGAVLIIGPGGQGKSTLSVAATISANFSFIGDDSVIVSNEELPQVYSLYSSAKLDLRSVKEFSEFEPVVNRGLYSDKYFLELSLIDKIQISKLQTIKAIIIPSFGKGKQYNLTQISPAVVKFKLIPSTTIYALGVERESFSFTSQLISSIPCFSYEFDNTRKAAELMKDKLRMVGISL